MKKRTLEEIKLGVLQNVKLKKFENSIISVVEKVVLCAKASKRIYVCGNGGSASDSEHIVGEFVKEFKIKRPLCKEFQAKFKKRFNNDDLLLSKVQSGIRAYSLTSNSILMTAIINDIGGDYVFSQAAYTYLEVGDMLFAFSTSGNSINVINAIKIAKVKGACVVGFTGASGGIVKELCDVIFNVDSHETYQIQEIHLPLYHIICAAVEAEMFS